MFSAFARATRDRSSSKAARERFDRVGMAMAAGAIVVEGEVGVEAGRAHDRRAA